MAVRFAYWRKAAGFHRKIDLARAMEVAPSMVTKWEAATMRPGIEYHHRFCDVCGISMEQFWSELPTAEG